MTVPQENLVRFDTYLLPCNISTVVVKPLTVFKLDDKVPFYYTALSKQSYSYNELLFISAKVITFMVISQQISEHKSTYMERERVCCHKSPSRTSRTTTDKRTVMLSLRNLRDLTKKLEPYQRPSDTPLTNLTRLLGYYQGTSKLIIIEFRLPKHQSVFYSSRFNNLFSSK